MSAPPLKVLIVDDSKLARMSIAKALKSLHPDCVVVSANTQAEIVDGTERLGVAFLPKPLSAKDLRAFLEIAMAQPR